MGLADLFERVPEQQLLPCADVHPVSQVPWSNHYLQERIRPSRPEHGPSYKPAQGLVKQDCLDAVRSCGGIFMHDAGH